MLTILLSTFHPAKTFWIGLIIVLAIIVVMNLIFWLLPPKKQTHRRS